MESTKTITVISVYSDKPIREQQYDKLSKIASRYVGTIYRFSDDSIIIIFGLPTAYENDHERAIEAAGELRFNFSSFRMGISTGDILIHSNVALDYKQIELTTEAFNLAYTAKPGQIFISPHLYSLVENIFRCKLHQQPTGHSCYEIIGISEQLKEQLKSKSSLHFVRGQAWRRGHSQEQTTSTKERQSSRKRQSSKAKFHRTFKKWRSKSFKYIYYFLITIAIIASVLAILIWGC